MDSFLIIESTWLLPDHEFFIKYAISFLFSKKGRKKSHSTFALCEHLLSIYMHSRPSLDAGEKGRKDGEMAQGEGKGEKGGQCSFQRSHSRKAGKVSIRVLSDRQMHRQEHTQAPPNPLCSVRGDFPEQ